MNYQWYESDINEVWIGKLLTSYGQIQREVKQHTDHWLKAPNFIINPSLNHRWAQWHKSTRTIDFSLRLLKQFEWDAVIHVMRHETAHQIVDELFAIQGKPHGEAWKTACKIVNIDPSVTESQFSLAKFKGDNDSSPIVDKIRKILIHGNDTGISNEESQVFLNKAQELMIKHNVTMQHIQGIDSPVWYNVRPVGPLVSGHRTWLGQIAYLVATFYNVQSIWLSHYCQDKGYMKRIEFFGTNDNLDVAEYVFHALLTQAEYLYEEYKDEQQKIAYIQQHDPSYVPSYRDKRRISKRAFMQGLVSGYRSKLGKSKTVILDKVTFNDKALISRSDKLLKEEFDKKYNCRSLNYGSSRGKGYNEGHKAGSNLSLAQGLNRASSRQLQLNA